MSGGPVTLWAVLNGTRIDGFLLLDGDTIVAADRRLASWVGATRDKARAWAVMNDLSFAKMFDNVEVTDVGS